MKIHFILIPFFLTRNSSKKQIAGDNLLNLFQVVLSDQHFAFDYHRVYQVINVIDTVKQAVPNV